MRSHTAGQRSSSAIVRHLRLGRLSVNPIRHVDPVGTLLVPIGLALLSGGALMFGWAKPVPVVFDNLRNPKRDMILGGSGGARRELCDGDLLGAAGDGRIRTR